MFGVIGGVSISKRFMAGILPGFLMGLALLITWWIVARKDVVQSAPRVAMRERVRVTADAFWSYLLAFTIIGGMKAGIFTSTDFAPTVLILTPVLMPLVRQAGIDPVYFGVLFIINNAIGLLTPPVGTVLNVVCGVGRIPMHDVIRGVWPFLVSQLVVLALLIAFPAIVMVPLRWLLP